jgi:hypothetical protein
MNLPAVVMELPNGIPRITVTIQQPMVKVYNALEKQMDPW